MSLVKIKAVLCHKRTKKTQISSDQRFVIRYLDSNLPVYIITSYIRNFKTQASFSSRAGQIESCLVRNLRTGFLMTWLMSIKWAAPSEFGTYRLCEQRRFRRACASAQSRQNLRCSLIQAVSQEEPSDRKPDPWPL